MVDRIYTDLAVIDVTPAGLRVHAMLQGVSADDLQAATEASLQFPDMPWVIALDAAGAPRYVRG